MAPPGPGKNQENERRPPGERYAHINAGHVPDFIRFGVKPHCYDELKCYTPSTRPRYKYKFNKYRVPLFSAGMCPVCRCPGSPAPPQYPSGALYGSRRPRPRPPRAPPRGRCPAHSSTPRVPPQSPMPQVAPTDLYALLCNHRANLYQATASRRDEILVVLGYAWGHLTLLAGRVVVPPQSPMPQVAPTDRKLRHGHARLLERACLTSACELSAASQQSPVHPTSSRRRLSYSSHISGSR